MSCLFAWRILQSGTAGSISTTALSPPPSRSQSDQRSSCLKGSNLDGPVPQLSEHVTTTLAAMLDLDAYLERIGLNGRPSLAQVHRAHLTSIPFENLDPHQGLPVSLQVEDLERKLVSDAAAATASSTTCC